MYKSLVIAHMLFQIINKRWKEKLGKSAFTCRCFINRGEFPLIGELPWVTGSFFEKSVISCLYNLPLKCKGSHVCKMGLKDSLWLGEMNSLCLVLSGCKCYTNWWAGCSQRTGNCWSDVALSAISDSEIWVALLHATDTLIGGWELWTLDVLSSPIWLKWANSIQTVNRELQSNPAAETGSLIA